MVSWLFYFDVLLVLLFFMSFHLHLSTESDSITPGQRLAGDQTLISRVGVFEMGFFAPQGNSHNYYIGIWYKDLPTSNKTVVWVANRDNPVSDPYSSWLELGKDGFLALKTSTGLTVWSTNSNSGSYPSNSVAGMIGDDGNFAIWIDDENIWQSFDYPTDTWLPGAMLGYDLNRGINMVLSSWQNASNPSTSRFSVEVSRVDPGRSRIHMLLKNGSSESKFCIKGFDILSNDSNINNDSEVPHYCFTKKYIESSNYMTSYYVYSSPCLVRYVLDVSGQVELLIWLDYRERWHKINSQLTTCDSQSGDEENKKMIAKQSKMKITTWIEIVASICLATIFAGIVVLLIFWRKGGTPSSVKATGGDTLKQYRHRDLLRATKNFTYKLGKGGSSIVYKGVLPGSTLVAVKEFQGKLQDDKQLRAEISTLGLIQHKNLVHLRGFCLEGSKRFIIYDYMPNGSLESHLFRRDSSNIIDWRTRYNIALGTAKGLAYLHEECRDCIIHCDIKPENILLDAEFNSKVADFGLAKLLCRNFSRVITTARGTRGYLAPEWFSGKPVTAKVDVYSYGQLLFEIISGRRNMDLPNNELSRYFPALVLSALNYGGDVLTLVDSNLEGKFNLEEVTRACKVACWCIQDHENDRPTMKQVVQILEGLIDVGIPPIPQFFLSIAKATMKENDIVASDSYCTASSMPLSFPFESQDQSIQQLP